MGNKSKQRRKTDGFNWQNANNFLGLNKHLKEMNIVPPAPPHTVKIYSQFQYASKHLKFRV